MNVNSNTKREPSLALKCAVCHKLPMDVVDSKCCASLFCWECGTNVDTCPTCFANIEWSQLQHNSALQKLIDNMEIKCPHEGCDESILVANRHIHQQECPFRPTMCPNSDLCGILLMRDLDKHLKEDCPERAMECPYNCGAVLKLSVMLDHIKNTCDCTDVDCSNGCGKKLKKKDLVNHLQNLCPITPIVCEFSVYGCDACPIREEYSSHLDEKIQEHLRMVLGAVRAQEQQIAELKQAANKPCAHNQCDIASYVNSAKTYVCSVADNYKDLPADAMNFVQQHGARVVPVVQNCVARAVPAARASLVRLRQEYTSQHLIRLLLLVMAFSFFVPRFICWITTIFSLVNIVGGAVHNDRPKLLRWLNIGIASVVAYHGSFVVALLAVTAACYAGYRVLDLGVGH